ncbi:MAG: carboxypeptidase regulatory-like domain-containing protein [Deltaproteobacteria bacterium]|nr:carboxypeptidase regulatory-like domain-containing protein [Deltaproteobacteria bacterium]
MKEIFFFSIIAGVVCTLLSTSWAVGPGLQIKKDGEIPYAAGGVGINERKKMIEMEDEYNLKLIFATQSGNYLAKVDVTIEDQYGRKLLNVMVDGPLMLVRLPQGEYMIKAYADKGQKTQRVVVDKSLNSVTLQW